MSVPEIDLNIQAGRIALYQAVSILPVFLEQDAHSIADALGMREMEDKIKRYRSTESFRGKAGEILNHSVDGLILCGLGSKQDFHPDRVAALFRKLGAMLVKHKGVHFNIIFSAELDSALENFTLMATDPDEALAVILDNKAKKKTQKKTKKTKKKTGKKITDTGEDEDEDSAPPDYFGPVNTAELVSQAVCSLIVGSDSMDLFKKGREKRKISIDMIGFSAAGLSHDDLKDALKRGTTLGRMVNGARYVASLPGNHFTPDTCEKYTRALAKEFKLKIQVFNRQKLEKMGCGGIISVGRGSHIDPRMISLEYKPKKKSFKGRVVLVGKGITFDTGGISLKPPGDMHEMKFDMCGAGLVLHAMALAAERELPIEIVGLIGVAENMPGGAALKPGDVYTAYNGMSVEVQNTDAEGRLVLADVLSYAVETYKPDYLLDFATLTGACVISLGHEAAGVMTSTEELAERIDLASRKSLDRSWRLPHWKTYGERLKSDVADLRNIGDRAGGTLSAMRFLSNFVPRDVKWAHLDIAGTAWRGKGRGSQPGGATGWGIRMLNQFFENLIDE